MIINEENSKLYSDFIYKIFQKSITDNNYTFEAFGVMENKKRLGVKDKIFKYTNPNIFAEEVLNIIKAKHPAIYKKYKNIIKDLSISYAMERIKQLKQTSVFTYFPY